MCKGVGRTSEQPGTFFWVLIEFLLGFMDPQHLGCILASLVPTLAEQRVVSWVWGSRKGFALRFGEGIEAEEGRPCLLGMKELIENTAGNENT